MSRSARTPERESLRRRLRLALVIGALVLSVVGATAVTALAVMRDRQYAIVDVYFPAITEADTAHTALVDAEAGIRGFATTGDPVSLETLERLTAEDPDAGPDTEALLVTELGTDHEVMRLRTEAAELLSAWYSATAMPIVEAVQADGTDAVSPAELEASQAEFATVEARIAEYTEALRAERLAAVDAMQRWLDILTVALAVLLVSAVAMGVLLWVFLRRWVTDPLGRLADDARQVAAGRTGHRVGRRGIGEVDALARDIEEMRVRLVDLVEDNARARDALERSHTALQEQAEDLRRSNRDLEQFAYVASHDLQEPLRKVASFTQLLSTRYSGQLDERADQYIAFAVDGAKRMQRLINDLLGFSRVGRIGAEVGDVDMGVALQEALGDLERVVEDSGATVEADDLPVVRGEAPLLVQLFTNLVGNAVKFRHPDRAPRVRITATRVADSWEFACQDNGIGIDPRYVDRVFVIFQRLHAKDVYEGTGIGLALCKKIVEYHGGDIWIDTEASEGTTIRWTLPTEDAPAALGAAHDRAGAGVEEETHG